jgi:hypothetical protein
VVSSLVLIDRDQVLGDLLVVVIVKVEISDVRKVRKAVVLVLLIRNLNASILVEAHIVINEAVLRVQILLDVSWLGR